MRLGRRAQLAPGGSAIPGRSLLRALRSRDARSIVIREVRRRFPDRGLTLHASGREAMRAVFAEFAARSGRDEVVLPAYGCFSIPASAVAAGLRVRLVDVDDAGRLSSTALARAPLDRAAAVVVTNLFGLPEPIDEIVRHAHSSGCRVIDDAAQCFGGTSPEGPVGGRGDAGILSFGRGKPLSALGGGMAIWRDRRHDEAADAPESFPSRLAAIARGAAYDVSRHPAVLGLLARIPALEIGATTYDVDFARGEMPRPAIVLAAGLLPELERLNAARRDRALAIAARVRDETDFVPLLEPTGSYGVFPRLAILAPSDERRTHALAALRPFGATGMYPTPIDAIRALRPHLVDATPHPGAATFCHRLLTLPTHSGLSPARLDEVVGMLAKI